MAMLTQYNPQIDTKQSPPERQDLNGAVESLIGVAIAKTRAIFAAAPWLPPNL